MFKNLFFSYQPWDIRTPILAFMTRRKQTRILAGEATGFIFCNRKFGAVIRDTSESGMKLSCEIKLGVGSIIQLVNPAITGKIIWRDDKKSY